MYTKIKSRTGDLEILTYRNAHSGHAFSIIPAFGALITSVRLGGVEVLDGPEKPESGINPAFRGSLLAPFANRVNHGRYSFQGKTYRLPVNEKARDNALHGFVYKQKFEVARESTGQDQILIELHSSYNGGQRGFPFPFDTRFTVVLDDREGLICTLEFVNTGNSDLPLTAGWHPYYTLQADAGRLLLKFPEGELLETDERMIPNGRTRKYEVFKDLAPIGERQFDNIFKFLNPGPRERILLKNPDNGITIETWQETSFFNYWVVYIPPERKSVAIEPMSGNIDAFNNGDGLTVIRPGKSKSGKFGLKRLD